MDEYFYGQQFLSSRPLCFRILYPREYCRFFLHKGKVSILLNRLGLKIKIVAISSLLYSYVSDWTHWGNTKLIASCNTLESPYNFLQIKLLSTKCPILMEKRLNAIFDLNNYHFMTVPFAKGLYEIKLLLGPRFLQ